MTADVILNDTALTARDGREEQHLVARRERGVPILQLVVDRDLAARDRVGEAVPARELAVEIRGRARIRAHALAVPPRALAERREVSGRDLDRHALVPPAAV